MNTQVRFTVDDLDFFPNDGKKYEVIDGELYVSTAPYYLHQWTLGQLIRFLSQWDPESRAGLILPGPGMVFAYDSAVFPDLVWISARRLKTVLGEDGKLHRAPDLVVEILSPGPQNEEWDRDVKLRLYSRQGVAEHWICDYNDRSIQVFRRSDAALHLFGTLGQQDQLTSPLLPGFAPTVGNLFTLPRSAESQSE